MGMINRHSSFSLDDTARARGLLASYFPVADPLMPLSRLQAYASARVDIVELGIKAVDPFADGTVVRDSMQRALGSGRVSDAREAIAAVRGFDYQAMGLVFGYASATFDADAKIWREVDGLLCLGSRPGEMESIENKARACGTRIVKFVSYQPTAQEMNEALMADGYVMLQYLDGKTGARSNIDNRFKERLEHLRSAGVSIPVLTGIGISTVEQVKHAMDVGADGVVTGSGAIEKGLQSYAALEDYLGMIREALDGR